MKLPTEEQQAKFAKLNETIAPVEERIRAEAAKIEYHEPKDAKPKSAAKEHADFVWVEDDFPAGAKVEVAGAPRQWIEGKPALSGRRALARTADGVAQDLFVGAPQPLMVGNEDKLFAHVFLDPANPPKAIMLQFHTSEWLHRANWGDEDAIPFGDKGTTEKLLMSALPKPGEWVRLEVEVAKLGLATGTKINGFAFTQFGGTVYWDQAGIHTATPQEDRASISLLAWEKQEAARQESRVPRDVRDAIKLEADRRGPEHVKRIRDYYLANV
jgi:hypothetical protein